MIAASLGDVLTVDQDLAAVDVVEPLHQLDERRLAGAGTADQPDPLAGAMSIDRPSYSGVRWPA